MSDYPTRPKFWAMKVIRTLQKTGAANHIGRDAAWLVTTIATLEDVKRYSGPVAFWNSHLMDVTGFSSKGTFVKARAAAVESGWLIYFEGRKGRAARYWTEIPENALPFLGADVLDDAGPDSDQKEKCRPFSGPDLDQQQDSIQTGKRTASGPHSFLCPTPVPDGEGAAFPRVSAKVGSDEDIATAKWMFDIVLKLQPDHKVPDFNKWANIIRLMRERDGRQDAEIRELFKAADDDEFWQKNIRCPATLRKQWDKLDLRFRKRKPHNGACTETEFSKVRNIVKRIWSPDLKNAREVEAAIGDGELFAASRQTGLTAIADAHDRDRDIERTFSVHLENIRSAGRGKT